MEKKALIKLKPKKRFKIPFDDKRKVLIKYTKHRITTRKIEGKCQMSELDGDTKVIEED